MSASKTSAELRAAIFASFVDAVADAFEKVRNDNWARHSRPSLLRAVDDLIGAARFLADDVRRTIASPGRSFNPDAAKEFYICLRQVCAQIEFDAPPKLGGGIFVAER